MAVARKTTESEFTGRTIGNTARSSTGGRASGNRGSVRRGSAAKGSGGKKANGTGSSKTARGTGGSKSAAAKRQTASAKKGKEILDTINEYRDHQAFETGITIAAVAILSLLLYLSYFSLAGNVGIVIGGLMFGIFGWFAWFLPLFALFGYIFWQVNAGDRRMVRKSAASVGIILSLLALTDLILNNDTIYEYYKINHVTHTGYFDAMFLACKNVMDWGKMNGGLIGRAFGAIFSAVIGRVGATLLLIAVFLFFVYIFYGMEMMAKLRKRNAYRQEMGEIYEQVREDEDFREPSYRLLTFRDVNKNLHKKPMRELKKVPQVHSFDLRGQAEFFEEESRGDSKNAFVHENRQYFEEEESKTETPKEEPKTKTVTTGDGKAENPEAEAGKAEEVQVKEVQAAGVKPEQFPVEKLPAEELRTEEFRAKEPGKAEEKPAPEVADFPIYRNELDQKFGRKKEENPAEPQMIVREDFSFTTVESAFDRFERKKAEASGVSDISLPKEEQEEQQPEVVASGQEMEEEFAVQEPEEPAYRQEIEGLAVQEPEEPAYRQEIEGLAVQEPEQTASGQEIEEFAVQEPEQPAYREEIEEFAAQEPEQLQTQDMWSESDTSDYMMEFGEEPEEELVREESAEKPEQQAEVWNLEEDAEDIPDGNEMEIALAQEAAPKKPMNSFAPKQEIDRIVIGEEAGGSLTPAASGKTASGVRYHGKETTVASENLPVIELSVEEPVIEKPYEFPSIRLLAEPQRSNGAASDEELRKTAAKLQATLESFNVRVRMGAVTCGPTVTRYELLPEQGVRVNKITNLADDLKLSLAAQSIRIEAPIPGKAAVGIEVPNAEASPVSFRELLEGEAFEKSSSPLTFAVGKDIAGKLIMADIAKMPHLLIAGATGSGKSVCINTLIMSILYKADPKDVKLIMIDPKVVELSCYNGIPHLFCPVVTDPKEAAASLNWAVREMMDRYNKFKELNVRNIHGYNEKIKTVEDAEKAGYVKMPYLVVIVDEFADLMMVASKDVEDAVCRLAQLARAAGIHLVLATQRPSVNVITGVIKANIPSRIAFSVSSAIDSRTILDKGGAEKLLGKGDMLFFPSGYTEPVRVQGAFVSDKEVNDVVEFLCDTNEQPTYNHAVTEIVEEETEEVVEKKPQSDKDEYFAEAGRFVIESERAAAGQLQRHFSIGFNRAGRIIDQLEKAGVVGPAAGTKPRTVLMTLEEFDQMLQGGGVSAEAEAYHQYDQE